jgi:hypothetical protein
MKVKITLVQFKSECLVCRFFRLAATHLYLAREGFSTQMWVCLKLNDTGNNLYRPNFADDLQQQSARSTKLCILNAFM